MATRNITFILPTLYSDPDDESSSLFKRILGIAGADLWTIALKLVGNCSLSFSELSRPPSVALLFWNKKMDCVNFNSGIKNQFHFLKDKKDRSKPCKKKQRVAVAEGLKLLGSFDVAVFDYRSCAIISHGLYISYPIFSAVYNQEQLT